ncbi:MAG: polysaccharide deacetylase family protein [Clostridia bacterium]|nr:polysaccharide deacetylase family protein [Clostridia bacterium]
MKKRKKNKNSIKALIFIIILIIAIWGAISFFSSNINKTENASTKTDKEEPKDNTAPEIILDEENAVIAIGEKYKTNAIAKDDIDGDITSKIEVTNLDTSKEGKYDVTLSVTDNAGNTTTKTQKVTVRKELSSDGLPVLMYHFFYDNSKYFKEDNNWLNIEDFEEQVKYMKENDFYFPTWEEVEGYIDGKIKLPSKSVVLTVDDGDASFFDLAVPVLQKYKVPATSFVITSWYGWRYDANMKYVVFESHSDEMHESGANGKGRMVNWTYNQIVQDLKKSSETLGGANVFCYPFGHYNDTAIKALKDANYILAFTVEGGRVTKSSNKYKLPRVRVTAGNSLNYFIKSIS